MQFLLRLMVNLIALHGSFCEFPCDTSRFQLRLVPCALYVVTLRTPNYHFLYALEQDPSPVLNTLKSIQFASYM